MILPINAFAFSYERSPAGSEITSPVTFNISATESEWGNGLNTDDFPYVCFLIQDSDSQALGVVATTNIIPWDGDEFTGVFTANIPVGTEVSGVFGQSMPDNSSCDTSGVATALTFEDAFGGVAFLIVAASTNSTWGSSNGFWGDSFSAGDVSDTLQASVQATGADIWPLFTFVGIAIAFVIGLLLVSMIQTTTQQNHFGKADKMVINPKGEEFIEHSVDDLEFKREYGQEKRKRGRPRKIV